MVANYLRLYEISTHTDEREAVVDEDLARERVEIETAHRCGAGGAPRACSDARGFPCPADQNDVHQRAKSDHPPQHCRQTKSNIRHPRPAKFDSVSVCRRVSTSMICLDAGHGGSRPSDPRRRARIYSWRCDLPIAELDNPFCGEVSIGPESIAHLYETAMKPGAKGTDAKSSLGKPLAPQTTH